MTNHAYQRTDADGNVVTSFDFPDVGELLSAVPFALALFALVWVALAWAVM